MQGDWAPSALDANFAIHAAWATVQRPRARRLSRDDVVAVDCGRPCDTFNLVLGTQASSASVDALVADVLGFFAERDHPFSWWVGPSDRPVSLAEHLMSAGLEAAEGEEAMAADLTECALAVPDPGELVVRRVTTPAGLADFARVNAANWTPPDPEVMAHFAELAPAFLAAEAPFAFFVGYVDGEAVAASELCTGGGVAGLYNISTLANARRRGYGGALTRAPLRWARAQGITRGVLQASADGAPVYRTLGFTTFGQVTEYKRP